MNCPICGNPSADYWFDPGLCESCFFQQHPEEAAYEEGRELGLTGEELQDYVKACEQD